MPRGRVSRPRAGVRPRASAWWATVAGIVVALGAAGVLLQELWGGGPAPGAEPVPGGRQASAESAAGASLAGLSARQAVAEVNRWRVEGGPAVAKSYVTTEALVVEWPDGRTTRVPLPAGERYVAIAPYVSRTHPCETHVISSCQGELVQTPLRVHVRTPAGRMVFEGPVTTLPNGFFELWVPADQELVVQVEGAGGRLRGTGRISTRPGARTCITDIQLRGA